MIVAKKHDWKNPADYKYTSILTTDLWAWQFLRRNPEYQADWDKAKKIYGKKDSYEYEMEEMMQDLLISSVPLVSARKWGLISGYVNPERDTPSEAIFVRSFGEILSDPRRKRLYKQNMLEYFEVMKARGIKITGQNEFIQEELESLTKDTVPEGSVAVTFDLSLPISPQIKYAKKILIECQNEEINLGSLKVKTPRKQHVRILRRYLRILDAKTERADNREIARHIFPKYDNRYPERQGNRMVKDSFKSAKNLVNKGYLKLLVKDPLEIL